MQDERRKAERQRQPVGEEPVRERRQHRVPRRHPRERQRRGQPRLDEAESTWGDGNLRKHLGGAEREQHEPWSRVRADRRERSEQGRVLERPARHRRKQRALPAGPSVVRMRSRSRSSLRGSCVSGSARGRSRLRMRWIVRPTHRSGRSNASSVALAASSTTKTITPMTAPSTRLRLTPPRISEGRRDGQGEHHREGQEVGGRQATDRVRASHARLHEQAVLESGADRAAAGRDLASAPPAI